MSDALFDVPKVGRVDPLQGVEFSRGYLPCRCPKCGSMSDESADNYGCCFECRTMMEPFEWHEYVAAYLESPHAKDKAGQIRKMAESLKAEHEKLGRYVELMRDKPGFDAVEVVDAANLKAWHMVSDFMEEIF